MLSNWVKNLIRGQKLINKIDYKECVYLVAFDD